MIVYHYLNREYGLQSLQRRRLRISIVHLLKDPFEHRAILIPEDVEPHFDKMLEDMAKPEPPMRPHGQGIICFSETCESPVMWSMYADNHEGVCLGFEIPEHLGALYQVLYVRDRQRFDTWNIDTMRACLTYKFDDWQYEYEHRLLVGLLEASREGEHYFAYYEPNMALRSVAVGLRSNITRADVAAALGDHREGVDVFKVRRCPTAFSMVRDERSGW